ncbi:protein neprosin-like [Euphorbia lathyris]|uniref:protein neprosin-like n=1 Tax=Euphorbia lathyris TaxID=212925 RepID=UPI003313B283
MALQNNLRVGIFFLIAFSHFLINVNARNFTIQSEDGDIIDCVNIYEQPAFRHPLLKDHIVQLRPSSSPPILPKRNKSPFATWKNYGNCPEGSIPISRTNSFLSPKTRTDVRLDFKHEYAKAFIQSDGPYFGTSARLNVWNTPTFDGETTVSQIWVQGGDDKYLNSIEAGWQVKAGDNKARLFIYWTRDNYGSTGCYNLQCPGFVQVNHKIAFDSISTPISTFNGPQYYMELTIHKDRTSGNWWLRYGNQELGYWPSDLFTSLKESANTIIWGGEVENSEKNKRHTSTQMGSGHYPGVGYKKAAFMFNLKYIDGNGQIKEPNQLQRMVTNEFCYDLIVREKDLNGFGVHFFYGGPGFTTSGQCL